MTAVRTTRIRRAPLGALLVMAALATAARALPQSESWSYLRPGNTGIMGDYCEAIWIGPDGDPFIAGYNPFWEDGGFAKFVQAENRWENYSTVDYPAIGDRSFVGAARIHDMTADASGKLWMATWIAIVEFDPAVGASSLARWDATNSPHPGGRTMDVDVAPDGTVWASVFNVSWGGGGLLRFDPSTQVWSSWGFGDTANGWPSGTSSCDQLAVQPKPGGGYTVWIEAANTNRMVTFDSDTQSFTLLPQTGAAGEVTGLAGHKAVDDVGNLWALRLPPGGGIQSRLEYRQPNGTWIVPLNTPPVGADGFKAFGDAQVVAADPSNGIWRFDGASWQYLGQWKTGNWTYAVDIDAAGNVWASGIGGAARRDAVTGQWQRYRVTNTSMLDYFTRDLVLDDAGGVWMTGNAAPGIGGFQHFDGERWFNHNDLNYGLGGPWGFPTDNADAIALRDDGTVVVNPMFNGIHEWTGQQYVDMQGMGTSDGLAVDSLDRVWSVGNYFSLAYHDGTAWNDVDIAGWGANVQPDPDAPGMVWALANFEVVRTDGTYRFSRETIDFPPFTPTSGTFTTVAAAPGGVAWVGSTKGLFRVDSNTGDFEWYDTNNSAIPGDQISPLAVTPDGRVWFTNQGTLNNWPDQGLGWFDGTDFGYYPQTGVGIGLPHAQIADMEVREIPGGYELWISCTSEGVAVLTIEGIDDCVAPTYCTAKASSQGCLPQVALSSCLSATNPSPAIVGASDVPNQRNGLLFYGFAPAGVPWLGGTLCVQPPLRRTLTQSSGGSLPPTNDCSGSYAFDMNDWIQSGADALLVPGTTVYAQYQGRDPQGSFSVVMSNAIEMTVEP